MHFCFCLTLLKLVYGYNCKCRTGYRGNPYILGGCKPDNVPAGQKSCLLVDEKKAALAGAPLLELVSKLAIGPLMLCT